MKIRRPANSKIAELKKLRTFAGLGARQLESIASNLDEAHLTAGERIMREGRHNDTFWIILDGNVDVTVNGRIHEKLGPGDLFGLPSMYSGKEAVSDGVAATEVRALVASHSQLNALLADPEVEIRFKAAMFDRLRDELYQLTRPAPAGRAPAKSKASRK